MCHSTVRTARVPSRIMHAKSFQVGQHGVVAVHVSVEYAAPDEAQPVRSVLLWGKGSICRVPAFRLAFAQHGSYRSCQNGASGSCLCQ